MLQRRSSAVVPHAWLITDGSLSKEKSGFTHAQNVEPVTFRPHENYGCEIPYTWRPTGTSIMRQDFFNPHYLKVSIHTKAWTISWNSWLIFGRLKTGCETSFHYLQIDSKYDHLRHVSLLRSDWRFQILDRPRPVWQEMLLITLDPLHMCGGSGHETMLLAWS